MTGWLDRCHSAGGTTINLPLALASRTVALHSDAPIVRGVRASWHFGALPVTGEIGKDDFDFDGIEEGSRQSKQPRRHGFVGDQVLLPHRITLGV